MSLDGFTAGVNPSREQPLGYNGHRLHEWMFGDKTDRDTQVLDEITASSGAVILGKRTYADAIDDAWGGVSPFIAPALVLAHEVPARRAEGFTFVTDGIESALTQARTIAQGKNVWVMGGANTIQQYLRAGLIDELQINLVPLLLGRGVRLFDQPGSELIELESTRVIESTRVTHLRFRVVK